MTEVIQWLTYRDWEEWRKKLEPGATTFEPCDCKSWRTGHFTVEFGQLKLTLKARVPCE